MVEAEVSGSDVIGTEIDPAVFSKTGSFIATTNSVQISGSLFLNITGSGEFIVLKDGIEKFKVNNEGTAIYISQSTAPTYISGGLFFSSSGDFYLGG